MPKYMVLQQGPWGGIGSVVELELEEIERINAELGYEMFAPAPDDVDVMELPVGLIGETAFDRVARRVKASRQLQKALRKVQIEDRIRALQKGRLPVEFHDVDVPDAYPSLGAQGADPTIPNPLLMPVELEQAMHLAPSAEAVEASKMEFRDRVRTAVTFHDVDDLPPQTQPAVVETTTVVGDTDAPPEGEPEQPVEQLPEIPQRPQPESMPEAPPAAEESTEAEEDAADAPETAAEAASETPAEPKSKATKPKSTKAKNEAAAE